MSLSYSMALTRVKLGERVTHGGWGVVVVAGVMETYIHWEGGGGERDEGVIKGDSVVGWGKGGGILNTWCAERGGGLYHR